MTNKRKPPTWEAFKKLTAMCIYVHMPDENT